MQKEFETKKLYYGFPIIVLGYKDDAYRYNITTISSSYSLGDMIVVGMVDGTNASKQIRLHKAFTVNVPTEQMMGLIEGAGFISGGDKLDRLDAAYRILPETDTPILLESPVVLECEAVEQVASQGYTNFIGRIIRRYIDESIMTDEGNLDAKKLSPVYFMGDGAGRVYRYLDHGRTDSLGEFFS